jgi:UDP-glucose 4-epimerase
MTGTVLVTGASGFVGRNLVPRLVRAGWLVRAAARDPAAIQTSDWISTVRVGDLAIPFDWRPLLSGVTHVVHLAAIAHADARIPDQAYIDVNAAAVRTLAQAAREAKVRRLLFVSSVRAQTGACSLGVLNERAPPRPTDAYGRAKLLAEQWLAEVLADGPTDWAVLRPVLLYGPGVKGNMRTLARLARSPVPLPFGTLSGRRSLLGMPNFGSAVLHALESPRTARSTFLVADPGPLTTPEIIAALRRGLGRRPGMFNLPLAPLRAIAQLASLSAAWDRVASDLIIDTSALEATGWRPVETAAEGLARWAREGLFAQA